MKYYDGTKILSMSDIDRKKPEIYMVVGNRSAGKTTYYNRLLVNRFLKTGKKFGVLYRYDYEVDGCAEKFFKDIQKLFFPAHTMTSEKRENGVYTELFLDKKSCGYAFALNKADAIKKVSHKLSDIDSYVFDEFQSETNHYCAGEVKKFQSIHTSIARGNGEAVRYVPVYMLSNAVSMINPYFSALNVSARLRKDTKFLRGNGWVLEQAYLDEIADAQKQSAFNRAFASSDYTAYATENVYLNDNLTFIENVKGVSRYICTFSYGKKEFAVREYKEQGIIYCSKNIDKTCKTKIAINTDSMQTNYIMIANNSVLIKTLRRFFELGCFRFADQESKEAVFKLISV